MSYIVKAPLVIAKNSEGSDLYVYEEGLVPDGQTSEWIERHVAEGMIVEGDPSTDDADASDEKPAGNASHSTWVTYAVSQGMDQDEAEALSRDELRDQFE